MNSRHITSVAACTTCKAVIVQVACLGVKDVILDSVFIQKKILHGLHGNVGGNFSTIVPKY